MEKAIHALEFNKIVDRLATHASFSASAELARALHPSDDLVVARKWVAETSEARLLFSVKPDASIGGARDVRAAAGRAERGITLQPQDLLDIRHTLAAAGRLKRTIMRGDHPYPLLGQMAQGISEDNQVIEAVDAALDDQGLVLDSASQKLARLRRDLRILRDRIQDKLQRILNSQAAKYLQEPIVTQRSGRWVIPLQSNFKGRIHGIVHDQSASGATLWIEPLATVDINNEYRELLLAEEEEVQRILAELSALVADNAPPIRWTVESLAAIDLAFCKAKYAEAIKAVAPELRAFQPASGKKAATVSSHPGSIVHLCQARHPLLNPRTVVPIDVKLDDDTYVVIITGPNTGGKTVSLKTVGLIALMAQAGLHVPCQEATLTIFEAIYADIGDEQSIEQSLSTFSGHMVNVVEILKMADEHSLVIFDELGAGTDPAEGSALARAILTTLRDKGATTFVATHYPELKLYGHDTPGVTNASVEFDLETLAPTFRLRIGLAGRSNAFAIAERLGLDPVIIQEARSLISDTELSAEDLLDSIHQARDRAEKEAQAARQSLTEAQALHTAVDKRLREIDLERLRILQDARVEAQQELDDFRQQVKTLRRQLSAAGQPLTEIRKLQQSVEQVNKKVESRPEPLPVAPLPGSEKSKRPLRVGDTVLITTIQVEGEILSLDTEEAEIQIGRLRTRAGLDELEWRKSKRSTPLVREAPKSSGVRTRPGGIELDLRGERVEGGLRRMETFLDNALLTNTPWVRIIHGKGTGRMRKAVREALQAHPQISRFEDGKDGEGGWGVTVAHLGGQDT